MVDDFNKKLTERLYNRNLQVNSDVSGKFDFILLDKDLRKTLGVNYSSDVTPMYEEYDDMIVEGRPNDKDEVIEKCLNMNLIFDVCTNDENHGTVVNRSRGLGGITIGRSNT